MDPAVGAALAQAAGSVAGSALETVLGGSAAKKAYKRQRKLLRDQIPLMVEGATKAGLHPLAAIGVNPATGPAPAQIGDFTDMGAGDVARALAGPSESSKIREGLENDLLAAQIGLAESQATASRATAAAVGTEAGKIGNVGVKDMQYSNKVQSAWGDWVEGILGAMRFAEDVTRDDRNALGTSFRDMWKRIPKFSSGNSAPSIAEYYSGHMY